jgi:acyl-CoA thioester hydrolase
MGVVYHGHYAQFFEIARTESIRSLGFSYKELESMGIMLPVTDMHTRFLRPIRYDDLITVTVTLRELPLQHKIIYYGEIHNEAGEITTSGTVTLYFVDVKTMKKVAVPEKMLEKLKPFYPASA